ncbi:MAG TPA: hypothetical protein VGR70_21535 [Stellaceae bacterium]|nr:hypothetical protein [Stellaceae bacterium]
MNKSEELTSPVDFGSDGEPEIRLAWTWLHRAYLSAYRNGCNYQFSVPANDQDIDILNREIVVAMIAYAREQKR